MGHNMKLLSILVCSTLVVYSSACVSNGGSQDRRQDPATYTCLKSLDADATASGWAAAAVDSMGWTICMGSVRSGCKWFGTENECESYRTGLIGKMGNSDYFDCDGDFEDAFGQNSRALG